VYFTFHAGNENHSLVIRVAKENISFQ